VAPNPVEAGASAEWTFSVENRSDLDVANAALRAELAADTPLAVGSPSGSNCSRADAGSVIVLDCQIGPLGRNAAATIAVETTADGPGDVQGSVVVAILDRVPADGNRANDTARTALSISERIGGGPVQRLAVADARASAAGDFDGDGMIDLAVGGGAGVLLFKGIADPADSNKRILAAEPVTLASNGGASALAAADLDGDGDLDIVAAHGAGDNNVVLLSAGDGGFDAAALAGSSDDSRAVAIGDLDGDGRADLVFANAAQSAIYHNAGGGTFTLAAHVGNGGARDVAIADLFGDASPEIVLASTNADAVVYRRRDASVEPGATIPTGGTASVATADFDGDGDIDLVFGRDSGAAHVYRNDSSTAAAFVSSDELAAPGSTAVLTADFDRDGAMDVVTINAIGGHLLHVNDRTSSATFTAHPERFAFAGARSAALGKISVDDRPDVIVVGANTVGIFFNDGQGRFGAGDTAAPTLTLRGEPAMVVTVGAAYQDAGVSATDAIDGDLSGKVIIENAVDPAVIGNYTVVYKVIDSSGNPATPVTRTVEVRPQEPSGGGGGGAFGVELALLALLRWLGGVGYRFPPPARCSSGSRRAGIGVRPRF
jgi:hypothetical protein